METIWIWVLVSTVFVFAAFLLWRRFVTQPTLAPQEKSQPQSTPLIEHSTIPAAEKDASPPDIPDIHPPATGELWRVLVVDDLPVWANQIRDYGRLFPCEVRHAARLSAAAQEVARWHPHLIILDLHMPRDPWQPIEALQGKYPPDQKTLAFCEQVVTHPKLKDIIVIFCSVEEQAEQQALTRKAGAADFFTKGEFSIALFAHVLQRVYDRQQSSPSLE